MTTSRRTFLRASAALAGAASLGLAPADIATAASATDEAFLNWRVREAKHAWDRGYRGRPDRTIGLTDTGVDARHPDLGPWNGVRAMLADDGPVLRSEDLSLVDADDVEHFAGSVGPGTSDAPARRTHPFTAPADVERVEASLDWTPADMQLDFYLEDAEGDVVDPGTGVLDHPEFIGCPVEPGAEYRYVVETEASATADYEVDAMYFDRPGEPTAVDDPFGDIDPGAVTPDTPKLVGWYNETDRYGDWSTPADPDGHGSHVSSIMGGTGRASALDPDTVIEETPRAVLALGDVLEYEVNAAAGTGVYGSAYGDYIEILIEGPDGQTLDRSQEELTEDQNPDDASLNDNVVVATPTVHDSGEATYTVYVRPLEAELVSTGTVERVSAGAFLDPSSTVGDRTASGDRSLHGGIAPDQSLVGLQGLGDPFIDLSEHADWFADTFNLRAVNMSWGYLGGAPLGYLFGDHAAVRRIAVGGILPVAAAGNSATPANSSEPGIADEAVSVVATGPLDGIAGYSSGGAGYFDPESGEIYRKPDVTAPGGMLTDLIQAAEAGAPDRDDREQPAIRDYVGKAGTSMASPYVTGIVGVVSQAMESNAAPDRIRLPAPGSTSKADVLRLKQAVLATASESALTAAPYHRAHVPTYDFGARDSFEGFGRANPGAAVDAVTRSLSGRSAEVVGLDVPADERAVAGHIDAGPGAFEVAVEFSHYAGGNKGLAKGDPHVDLFVYDAENPTAFGEPNIVARAQGLTGDVSVTVTTEEPRVFYVVAKLVNVPGAVNGYDVQAHLELSVEILQDFTVSGSRADDGSVFTGGQTDQIDLAVEASEAVELRDVVPLAWDVLEEYGDVDRVETHPDRGIQHVYFAGGAEADRAVTYFAEAPSGAAQTGEYVFGPVEVRPPDDETWYAVAGTTDTNVVVAEET